MTEPGWGFDGVPTEEDVELAEFEYDREEIPPSRAVVEAIADVEDVDPVELSTGGGATLYDHVEPDALDRFVSSDTIANPEIRMSVDEYTVWVDTDVVLVAFTAPDDQSA